MRSTILLSLIAMAGLLGASCAGTRPVRYYTLEPASAAANPGNPNGATILVGDIATPEALQDDRIDYRVGANEVGAYEYHRWIERPGAMVRDSLVRALRSSGKYQRVIESSSSAIGDYLIHGKLYEFDEADMPTIQTRISLHLELVDKKTNRNVWDSHFERTEPASGKSINDVVESMDRNLRQVVREAAAEIDKFLAAPR
jgi:cholesterol transport system auxiliary component